jgi:hypothetical protein
LKKRLSLLLFKGDYERLGWEISLFFEFSLTVVAVLATSLLIKKNEVQSIETVRQFLGQ